MAQIKLSGNRKYTMDEEEWKTQEEWRRKREIEFQNQMVSFFDSLEKNKIKVNK